MITGTPPIVRVVNRHLLLDRLRHMGQVSRADLAKLTEIRAPTVGVVIREMIAEGLVEEVGEGTTETGTGRPPRMVALSRKHPRALGFEVGASTIRGGLCYLDGSLAVSRRMPFSPGSPEDLLECLADLGQALLDECKLDWSHLDGVGVALPGLVDSRRGIVRWSRPFDWHMVDFGPMCENRWGTHTDLVNNAVAGSMAEHSFGVGRGIQSLVYVFVRFDVMEGSCGTPSDVVRLGSGIIINSEPFHGEFGAAGEITSLLDHPRVLAGKNGGQALGSTESFVQAFEAGDKKAVEAMEQTAREIAARLMDAINFLDPGIVIIDSDYAVLRSPVLKQLSSMVEQDSLRGVVGRTNVVGSELGEFGMVLGAVTPVLERIFGLPQFGKGARQ